MGEVVERPAQRELHSIEQFCSKYKFLTTGSLRWQVFNAESTGLAASGAVVRIGKRVFIDEPRYFSWVDAQQKRA